MVFKKNNPGCGAGGNCGCEQPTECLIYSENFLSGGSPGDPLGSPWDVTGTIVWHDPSIQGLDVTSGSLAIHPTGATIQRSLLNFSVNGVLGASQAMCIVGYSNASNYLYALAVYDGSSTTSLEIWQVVGGSHTKLDGPVSTGITVGTMTATYNGTTLQAILQAGISVVAGAVGATGVTGFGSKMGFGSKSGTFISREHRTHRCVCDSSDNDDASLIYEVTFEDLANGTCTDAAILNDTFRVIGRGAYSDVEGVDAACEYLYYNSSIACTNITDIRFSAEYSSVLDRTDFHASIGPQIFGRDVEFRTNVSGRQDLRALSGQTLAYVTDSGKIDGSAATCTVSAVIN